MIYLKQFESEFNEFVVQITTIQKELDAKKLQRQSKRGQHNRLLNVAKNKWAITKNPL
jgi:Skp family chaperone for outer membrane proteins